MLNPLKKRFPSLQSLGGDGNTSFLRAARAGNLDKVLEHLKNNIDINTSNANGLNALHLASKDGHIHVVSELLRRGAIVDSATKKGNTALHIASLAGQEEVVKLLLQHGASVNVQSQNGFTPLYMAAQENHDSVVKLLLSNGANQSLATEDGFTPLAVAMQQGHDKVVAVLLESDTRGKVRLPALHIAAKKDDVKAATLLLDNDHNPDVTSKSGFTPLHIASHYGNQPIANLLIQKGADVNFSAKHNISPLHVAAKWGKTNMVSLLLEKGANIEAKTRDGLTPLHCAARSGHEQVVDMLLERGAPISAKTKNGLAPLHMAAQGEHVDAARILLYHRAPVDEVTVDYLTALHVAAHCGHVRVAKLLLDRNADANARALNGFTPLHIACKKNRIKVVELLLRHGASISATTESGLTPLHVAAFMGCMNIVIYLLQHDASPDVPTVRGETPLHLAARANQTDIIRILLRNGAQVDARAREQQTPLHIASRLGNVDIVMLLLQHGAQVDATTKDMYTALHIAAKEGQDEVAAVLIENGAALDAATKKGFTPLHLTAKYGHIKVAQLLLQKEADVDAQGKNGVTPLHVACHYDNQNVALLLLEKGASPHATAKNGHTPLHIAARKNQMDIATTLLEYGAQANAESKAGFTPLHLSCQEGHSEISNLLIEHKAGVNQPAKNGLTPMHLCAQEDNVNVAEILQRNGANIDMATKAGYTPLHVAAHFGQANMVRFLLQHGANVNAATSIGYTPLHQSAQQGHCHIVKLLLEHNANANAQTTNGQTPLDIARKLGYISVLDSLKSITDETEAVTQLHSDEKYRVVAPEAMHESFMSDSEEEGGEDNMLSDQPYRYLTVDEMKSLGDDSLPIDVTRDERVDSNRMAQSAEYAAGLQQQPIVEDAISPHKAQTFNTAAGKSMVDGIYMANGLNDEDHPHVGRKLQWKSFLVSFLVDARGGAMRGCRHSGVRMIVPSRSTCQPTRVTCRYVKPQRTMHPPQLMEGEALASRVLELGPVSTKFIGPVIMEVPHFASLRGKEREIIILRSDNGETWREHTIDNSEEIIHDVLQQCFEPEEIAQLEEQAGNHVCRFVTYDFPQYFAVVTRIRQEVHAIGPEGGMVSSTVVPQVQAVFPQGALTKKIKVGLQAQPVDPDLTAKLLGRGVAVSPIVTVEPRRRKFHKAITLSMPAPKAHSQGMINQYSGNTPTLRLLCSITGGPSRAQWEDVTGSTPLTFVNDCVSFTTTVSARFWLMDCRNISEATKMATELYKEVIHVPFIAKFVVFAKKIEPFEARLRVFCMTDDREDKTLEKIELYTQVAKSRDVEVLEGKPQYIEMAGNLVPVTKSGEQLQLPFKAFRENRLPFTIRVKDQHADIVGRTLFMKEPKVAKGEPPQHPICILNIVLPEAVIPDSVTAFSDKITPTYRSSLLSFSKHQNDHYIGDIRIVDLSNLLGKDWIRLASEINISTEEIDEIINQNTDSIARQAQSMIRLYKDKPNYDIHSLEQALKNIGRDDIMSKCKSGRLSHSRDFDETDIMKNSESVEELVRQESKRIQQIHEREEVKYSAEEKEIEESESDEEIAKRTVAERREKIVKRLSIERQIPASSQKKEITREITEIKRKSLIEDKKAIHESEIFMQLPADNSVKSSVIPDQIIKMKMGKMDSAEVSKSEFDKELTHKFKSSSRSSEEEPEGDDTSTARHQVTHEEVENLKIVKDISSVEKPSKLIDTLKSEKPSMSSGSKQLTKDFLAFEKFTQLPSQVSTITTEITEKFVEIDKDKPMEQIDDKIKKTAQEVVSQTVETASKKVENIISTFETSKPEKPQPQYKESLKEVQDFIAAESKITPLKDTATKEKPVEEIKDTIVSEITSVKDKIKAFTEPKFDDILSLETEKKTIEIEGISSKITDVELKDHRTDTKEFPNGKSKSVAETIKALNGDAKKGSFKLTSEIETAKDSIVDNTKIIYDKKSEDLKDKVLDMKKTIVSETQMVTEIVHAFAESKIDDINKEIKATETSTKFSKDSLFKDTKISSEVKRHHLKEKGYEKVDTVPTQIKSDVFEREISTLKEKPDSVSEEIISFGDTRTKEFHEHVNLTKKFIINEAKDSLTKTKEQIAQITKPTETKSTDSATVRDTISESKDFIITESKTVAETIKSFSDPKVTTSKLEEKHIVAESQPKGDSKKLTDTIKSLSEPMVTEHEKEKIIPSTKIEEKIADFEAKKVVYEYHGLEPKPRSSLVSKSEPEEKEIIEKEITSAPEAAPRKLTASVTEQATFKESLENLKEMKSIVADAREITKSFLSMEQQTQLPIPTKVQLKEETKLVEEIVKTTITFPSIVETSSSSGDMVEREEKPVQSKQETTTTYSTFIKEEESIAAQSTQETRKLTHEFLTMEQKSQQPYEKQTADDISELSTETSEHSVEKSSIIEHDSEKISLEQFEKPEIDTRKITHDFLSMEQKHQPFTTSKQETKDDTKRSTSIVNEVLIQTSDIITTISAGTEVPRESLATTVEETFETDKAEKSKDDGIEIAAPIKASSEMTASTVKTITQDFLSFEQTQPTYTAPKTSAEDSKSITEPQEDIHISTTKEFSDTTHQNMIKITGDFLSMEQSSEQMKSEICSKSSDELKAPLTLIEPRKSLTDAEFCKSVQESITKKMSEGLIEISDEIKIKESDIPYSQTPPPTPIETKSEKQDDKEIQQKPYTDEDNLKDTIKTLHKTTESSFERVSTISTIETLQSYIPEPQAVSIESVTTQETNSTDITPVPPSTGTTVLTSTEMVTKTATLELATDNSVTSIGVPQPKPRSVVTCSPTEEDATQKSVFQLQIDEEEHETSLDLIQDSIDTSVTPVPKPRSQMKTSDSFKNLESLNDSQSLQQEHQAMQSDSVSLRSFDYTEEISRTDDPSVSVSLSVKSQPLDYPFSTTATTTTSEEPATESIDPPSELSIDDVSAETERRTSFYIGESSRNIIIKTTPTKPSVSEGGMDEATEVVADDGEPIAAADISIMKEFSVDSDDENDVFKEYVTMKTPEPDSGVRIRRQSSETRNDLLEEDVQTIKQPVEFTVPLASTDTPLTTEDNLLRKTSTEQSFTTTTVTSTTSTGSAPLEVIHSTGEDDSIREISESMDIETERPVELDLPLEKSEWETTEKEIPPPPGKEKVVHSPQQTKINDLTKEKITEEMVKKTLEEVQESLDAANNELKTVLKDAKSIKESPSEFEFRSFSQILATTGVDSEADKVTDENTKSDKLIKETINFTESDDISSFIGIPENIQDKHSHERVESMLAGTTVESLNREAAILHYSQSIFDEKKADLSLGFISTGTAESQDSHSSCGDNIIKEERASLGFISSETAEDFSSMEDYYQEKLAKADVITEEHEEKQETVLLSGAGVDKCSEITSDVVHRLKTDSADTTQNRWSVPEVDQSSSSESYYKSFEKTESRPLSSDIDNLMTQGNSSEYQTAADLSSVCKETTEFVSAVSTFESSSGKTISSHESMRSLDSQSETSANLGSIDVSELSETLVASSTEEAEEIRRLQDLANEDDSDDSLNLEDTDYTISEGKMLQKSQMKRSQEMIFKPKSDVVSQKLPEDTTLEVKFSETVPSEEYTKSKEIEKAWDLAYPMEEIKAEDLKDADDILLYHGDARRSIDESKYASSLDEGSILSVSMSSTSNIDTVVENFEDIVGSVGASSLAGIEGFVGSLPEETTFAMEVDVENEEKDSISTTPPEEMSGKRGHKRSESTAVSEEELKNMSDKDVLIPLNEGKESESESDTDPYETEYARQFRSPSDRKTKKKKQAAAEMDHSFEAEKRPFTPSQLVAEVIVEDAATEELEAEECLIDERRPSQNMLNYANIPDITVTEDAQPKSPILKDTFEEKSLYKVKTEEELHKATDDRPLHEEKEKLIDIKEENFQKLVQEQYKQKLEELKKAEIGVSGYDYNKAPDSPDSFEMVDQPDISDEFVIIEEVAKEANEDDLGGKSIRIAQAKYESKHDEEVEKIIIKSAPADPKLGSQIFRDDLNFEFEESPPTGSSGETGSEVQDESDSGQDMAANNKRWVEMQLTENQLRYPYDLTGGVLEDIKEEDGEFEVGSSRISSFKDSFSSTPEYDVMAARRYYASRGEHDDVSMSSLQEFESLEQAISLENRNRTHQGSTDSSNGSFQRRYILRNCAGGAAQGDDISISSLKEFEGLENACIEAHLIEIKAKEEAALLSRSDESNKSNGSDCEQVADPTKVIITKVSRTVAHTEISQSGQQAPNIETLLKQKLLECERAQTSVQITDISKGKTDSDKGSIDSLDINRSIDMVTSSVDDSFEVSKDGTTKSDIDSLEVDKHQPTREESIESMEMEHMDDVISKFGVAIGDSSTTTTTTTTTSTDADGREHTTVTTRIVTKSTYAGGSASSVSLDPPVAERMSKDISIDSLNQISAHEHTTTSSAGTTATYQTSAGNSQMSGSITSCASSTLMEDSAMSTSGITTSTSYWSHEEETVKDGNDIKPKDLSPH